MYLDLRATFGVIQRGNSAYFSPIFLAAQPFEWAAAQAAQAQLLEHPAADGSAEWPSSSHSTQQGAGKDYTGEWAGG